MEVEEEDHVAVAIKNYMEEVLRTESYDHPALKRALDDAMEQDKQKEAETDRLKRLITPLRKKDKKAKIEREKVKGAHVSDEEESSSDDYGPGEKAPLRMASGPNPFAKVVLTSKSTQAYEDDTPNYTAEITEMSSGEDELVSLMKNVSIKMSEQELLSFKQQAFDEIKKELDSMGEHRGRLFNQAWRRLFVMVNTSEILDEEDLVEFLNKYVSELV